jgi:hypothetical protein
MTFRFPDEDAKAGFMKSMERVRKVLSHRNSRKLENNLELFKDLFATALDQFDDGDYQNDDDSRHMDLESSTVVPER